MHFFREGLQSLKPNIINVPHKTTMLCLNESPFNPMEDLKEEIFRNLAQLHVNRYYSDITEHLKDKLAQYVGVEPDNILMGNGADELLYYLFVAARSSDDDRLLCPAPSYFDYITYSKAVGLNVETVDLDRSFNLNTTAFIEKLRQPQNVCAIICNPNNPTGNMLRSDDIISVIQSTDKPVLIDEAYFEFSNTTLVNMLESFPNLLILRSFSKGFFAAGLRFGYMIGNKDIIYELKKVMTAFNLSLVTQNIATTFLDNLNYFTDRINILKENRNYLRDGLRSFDELTVYDSHTNFITVNAGEHKERFFDFITDSDIAIRDVSAHSLLKDSLRISVGTVDECDLFLRRSKSYFK